MRRLLHRKASGQKPTMALPPGDRFEECVLPHLDSVFRVARRLTGSDVEADDLVQETMLRAYRAFPRFEMREYGVKPWVLKILRNTAFTLKRKAARQPRPRDDAFLAQLADGPEGYRGETGVGKIDWDSIDEDLKRAVDSLQPEYRSVLLLWSFEEMSYKEIADVCDCAIGTVMSRLYRARQLLAERLAAYTASQNVPKKT